MLSRVLRGSGVVLTVILLVPAYTSSVFAAEGRQIEEVVVTAERRESTVQDTAISITAFTGEFIEDFGLRNQEDLQNYIPATTIQPYDLSVRGIGRLYRALGGGWQLHEGKPWVDPKTLERNQPQNDNEK